MFPFSFELILTTQSFYQYCLDKVTSHHHVAQSSGGGSVPTALESHSWQHPRSTADLARLLVALSRLVSGHHVSFPPFPLFVRSLPPRGSLRDSRGFACFDHCTISKRREGLRHKKLSIIIFFMGGLMEDGWVDLLEFSNPVTKLYF